MPSWWAVPKRLFWKSLEIALIGVKVGADGEANQFGRGAHDGAGLFRAFVGPASSHSDSRWLPEHREVGFGSPSASSWPRSERSGRRRRPSRWQGGGIVAPSGSAGIWAANGLRIIWVC